MKTAKFHLCPVEGFVSETDSHAFIYDCKLNNDLLSVQVTNLCFLTSKPVSSTFEISSEKAFCLIHKGAELGYEVIGCSDFNVFQEEFNSLNPNLIESLMYLNERIY